MENPFFRSRRSNYHPLPRHSPSFRDVPVQRPAARPSPRVVSIPVHFVGSDRSRSDSALKIQSVFRGFLVRKSVKKIAAVKREVDEVEKKMRQRETVEAIRSDAKERLRLNETLMSLLLRLDSVRGVDSGVRDCRKSVIKKAIKLQERIDAIVAGDQTNGGGEESSEEVANAESVSEVEDQAQHTRDSGEIHKGGDDNVAESEHTESEVDQNPELRVESSEIESVQTLENEDATTVFTFEPMPNSRHTQERKDEHEVHESEDSELKDVEEKAEPESAMVGAEETAMEAIENEEALEESSETESESQSTSANLAEEESGMEIVRPWKPEEEEGGGDSRRRSKELMERMLEDNEKLMGIMAELNERSAMQTRLLSSLSQRVEQLERAFLCEKLLRKKKKQRRECRGRTADAYNNKNCGNRL